MEYIIDECTVYLNGYFRQAKNVHFNASSPEDSFYISDMYTGRKTSSPITIRGKELYVLPGFTDVHVHLREPGFSYKETIATGTMAAAKGGYTRVCSMPNLKPCPDSSDNLKVQEEIIARDANVPVYPYGTITKGQMGVELSDMDELAERVIAFTDDGRGVQDDDVMRAAMKKARSLGKMIVSHCEDNSLLRGGYIHDGEYARANGHRGISSESEWRAIARDLALVRETGVSYHVCHVSAAESVELIRQAKREGLDVTCETGPHYLILDDSVLQNNGRFKMNPPLRAARDREALIEGILDGTIDMIATDHAPHSAEEKNTTLENALMGVVGLETALPVLYHYLVKTGIVPFETVIKLLHENPEKRFGIKNEQENNFSIFDLGQEYNVNPYRFKSKGRATPFDYMPCTGECLLTVCNKKVIHEPVTAPSVGF